MTLQEAVDQFGYISSSTPFREAYVDSQGFLIDRQLFDYEVTANVLPEYELQAVVGDTVNWNGEVVTLWNAETENGNIIKAVFKPNVIT